MITHKILLTAKIIAMIMLIIIPFVFIKSAKASTAIDPTTIITNHRQTITNSVKSLLSNPMVRPGDRVTYTIEVTTTSVDPIAAEVKDVLPLPLTLLVDSIKATNGTPIVNERLLEWRPGVSINRSAIITYSAILTTTIEGNIVISNTAEIKDSSNNITITRTATMTVQGANLSIGQSVTPTIVQPGDTITYTITVTNSGTEDAVNVLLTNQWLDSLPITKVVTVTTRMPYSFNVTHTVTNNLTLNDWLITHTVEFSHDSGSNQTLAVITAAKPILSIQKQVSNKYPKPNQVVSYTIVMTNSGLINAENVHIVDNLPQEITPLLGSLDQILTITAKNRLSFNILGQVAENTSLGLVITNTINYTHDVVYDYPTKTGHDQAILMVSEAAITATPTATPMPTPGQLHLSETSIYLEAFNGQFSVVSHQLIISHEKTMALNWRASLSPLTINWLELQNSRALSNSTSINGITPSTVKVIAKPQGLNVGTYTAFLVITADNATNSPITTTITLNIKPNKAYLPVIIREPTPPPQPTATSTATPLSLPQFKNPGFEAGRGVGWIESLSKFALIYRQEELRDISPRSGSYVAWLGGADNETADLAQTVSIPTGFSHLYLGYWYSIASAETICTNDKGWIQAEVNGQKTLIYSHKMCGDTVSWQYNVIDISQFSGQDVTFHFHIETNPSKKTNWFIDDVSFERSAQPSTYLSPVPPNNKGIATKEQ